MFTIVKIELRADDYDVGFAPAGCRPHCAPIIDARVSNLVVHSSDKCWFIREFDVERFNGCVLLLVHHRHDCPLVSRQLKNPQHLFQLVTVALHRRVVYGSVVGRPIGATLPAHKPEAFYEFSSGQLAKCILTRS